MRPLLRRLLRRPAARPSEAERLHRIYLETAAEVRKLRRAA